MKLDWFLYRILEKLKQGQDDGERSSYAQCGEDLIVRFIFDALRIPAPSYLDIGAHHPTYLNNTYLFYQAGGQGVNIEPDPSLISAFKNLRARDINLNVGISDVESEMDFYLMSVRTLNTFSAKDAKVAEAEGKVKIEEIIRVPVTPINNVLRAHFLGRSLDFVTLDVEGLDLMVLQTFDFKQWRPKVVCVETITYSEQMKGKRIEEIPAVMLDNNYFAYADTGLNTIFVDRDVW